jgi:hypothetical protein
MQCNPASTHALSGSNCSLLGPIVATILTKGNTAKAEGSGRTKEVGKVRNQRRLNDDVVDAADDGIVGYLWLLLG